MFPLCHLPPSIIKSSRQPPAPAFAGGQRASPLRALLQHGQAARDIDKHGRCSGLRTPRLLVVLGLEKPRRLLRAAPRVTPSQPVPDALLRVLLLVALPGGGRGALRQRRQRPGGLRAGGAAARIAAQPRAGPAAQGHQGAHVGPAPEEGQREGEAAHEDLGRRAPHAAQLPAPRVQPARPAPHQNTDPEVHHQVHRRAHRAPQQRQAGVEPAGAPARHAQGLTNKTIDIKTIDISSSAERGAARPEERNHGGTRDSMLEGDVGLPENLSCSLLRHKPCSLPF